MSVDCSLDCACCQHAAFTLADKRSCACADVAQPDQARIVGINAQYFLKNSGNFVISIKASCIDSTAPPEAVFAREVCSHINLNPQCIPLLDIELSGYFRVCTPAKD